MTRIVLGAALAAVLIGSAPARAADPLSYRLKIVASPFGARASDDELARRLSLAAEGAGSLLRRGSGYVVQVRGRPRGLRAAGAEIVDVSREYGIATVVAERDELRAIADAAGVVSVTEELTPMVGAVGGRLNTCVGAKTSEGDSQLRALLTRTDFELDGAGVEVGVLSDSYNTSTTDGIGTPPATSAAGDIASGDLPGPGNSCGRLTPVEIVEDFVDTTNGTTDEGRAMAQIVHDIAPGADLSFATAFTGELNYAQNIIDLEDAGAEVIVDDVIYFQEPMFQDGPIANAVSTVTDAGVAYFSMAFNNNQVDGSNRDIASFEAPAYRPTTCPTLVQNDNDFIPGSTCMDFDPGAGTDSTFGIGVVSGRILRIAQQWAEPRNGVATDLDLYLLNTSGSQVSAESHNVNATTQQPFEFAQLQAGSTGTRDVVLVRRPSTTGTPRLKFVVFNNGTQITSFEYPTSSGGDVIGPSIIGHNGTAKAQSVGAIRFDTLAAPEPFSSRGPVTHYFGPVSGTTPAAPLGAPLVLSKPDVTATNGGANTFFGQNVGGTFRFFGTSAAAPHAAAVAALQLQGNPSLTPAQVKNAQKTTATAIGAFGPFAVGSGLVDARAAVALNLLAPVVNVTGPPAVTNDTQPPATFTANRPATFTCALDGSAASPCTSPFTPPTALSDADHTLVIVATDRANRTDTETVGFRVDTVAPTVTVSSGPTGLTNLVQPAFGFTPSEAGVAQCRFDAEAFIPCTTPLTHTAPVELGQGAHVFEVRVTDAAGNPGTATATRSFTVDSLPPAAPAITGGPTGAGAAPSPTFTFTFEAGANVQCRFDTAAFGPCSGTGTHAPASPLGAGPHVFAVRATDSAGNTSADSTRAFTVGSQYVIPTPTYTVPTPSATAPPAGDRTPPVLRFTKKPKKSTNKRSAKFAIRSSERLAKLECRLDKRGFRACQSPRKVKVKPGRHTFSARGTDRAGNVSAVIAFRWTVKRR